MEELRIHTNEPAASPLAAASGWTQRVSVVLQRALRAQAASDRRLKRLETLALGQRKSVHLIECDGRRFLLADGLSTPVAVSEEQDQTAL